MKSVDLVVENGILVFPEGVMKGDIAVQGEKIFAIGSSEAFPLAKQRIDAAGKFVLPGAIDTHTHFGTVRGITPPNDWHQETISAAFGGVTMVIDFAWQGVDFEARNSLNLMNVLETKVEKTHELSAIDFSFHGVFANTLNIDNIPEDIRKAVEYGISSFKIFMGQPTSKVLKNDKRSWWVDDWGLYNVLAEAKKYGAIVGVHAENSVIGDAMMVKFAEEERKTGKIEPAHIAKAKPNIIEEEAIQRAMNIARLAGARLYIVHTTTKEGVEMIRASRAAGLPVFLETCPQYLLFTDEYYQGPNGFLAVFSPPLRKREDQEALWRGLADGTVSFTGTDHISRSIEQKIGHIQTFMDIRGGHVGAELRLPILYSEGVGKGRLTLSKFVQVCSTNAAKVFGLYPRKGTLFPGSDADIVILDPDLEKTIKMEDLHINAEWTMYEGMKLRGFPIVTILRGKVIVKGGHYLGKAGDGEFIKARIEDQVINSI